MGSVYHGYIHFLLYMKLMWCSSAAEMYGQLEEGVKVNLPWVYVHFAICEIPVV